MVFLSLPFLFDVEAVGASVVGHFLLANGPFYRKAESGRHQKVGALGLGHDLPQ